MLDCRELSPCSLRTAHSTRQQASLVHGFPRLSSHLIHLLAVLSSQCSGLSSPVGEMAAPSLPQGGPQERVGAERRGSSPGLPQHPPTLGSARWSLWVFSSCGASVGFHTRYDGELREPLVWRQGSQVSMYVARGSGLLLSSHGRGI